MRFYTKQRTQKHDHVVLFVFERKRGGKVVIIVDKRGLGVLNYC